MSDRATIFMLHRLHDPTLRVHGHSLDFIRASLSALRESGAKFVSLRTLVDAWRNRLPIDPDWVVFTIDDGFADQAILVREAFAPMQCPVTVFLISGFLDGQLWPWDDQLAFIFNEAPEQKRDIDVGSQRFAVDLTSLERRSADMNRIREYCKATTGLNPYEAATRIADQLGVSLPKEPPTQFRPMTWDTVRELEREGVAQFGPHSVSHRIFSTLSAEESRQELQQSWARLQEELANPLPILAWPTGRSRDFAAKDVANAKAIGLHASVATDPGYAYRQPGGDSDQIYRLRRFAMPNDLTTVLRYGSWLERGRELLPV
jgi:peptidoglycan/xylan/chitin deacetylase (PgdA/CDA1 family)